jgi:hypothetical protein
MNVFMIPIILGILSVILAVCLSFINWWKVIHIHSLTAEERMTLLKTLNIFGRMPQIEYVLFLFFNGIILLIFHFFYPHLKVGLYFGISLIIFFFAIMLMREVHKQLINMVSNR